MSYARSAFFLSAVVLASAACSEKERPPLLNITPGGAYSGLGGAAGAPSTGMGSGTSTGVPGTPGAAPGAFSDIYKQGADLGANADAPICSAPDGAVVGHMHENDLSLVNPATGEIFHMYRGDIFHLDGEAVVEVLGGVDSFTFDHEGNLYYTDDGDLLDIDGNVVIAGFNGSPVGGKGTILRKPASSSAEETVDIYGTDGTLIKTHDLGFVPGLVRSKPEGGYWILKVYSDFNNNYTTTRYSVDEEEVTEEFTLSGSPALLDEEGNFVALEFDSVTTNFFLRVANEGGVFSEDLWPRPSKCWNGGHLFTVP